MYLRFIHIKQKNKQQHLLKRQVRLQSALAFHTTQFLLSDE